MKHRVSFNRKKLEYSNGVIKEEKVYGYLISILSINDRPEGIVMCDDGDFCEVGLHFLKKELDGSLLEWK